jgi:hypothetical protein
MVVVCIICLPFGAGVGPDHMQNSLVWSFHAAFTAFPQNAFRPGGYKEVVLSNKEKVLIIIFSCSLINIVAKIAGRLDSLNVTHVRHPIRDRLS